MNNSFEYEHKHSQKLGRWTSTFCYKDTDTVVETNDKKTQTFPEIGMK